MLNVCALDVVVSIGDATTNTFHPRATAFAAIHALKQQCVAFGEELANFTVKNSKVIKRNPCCRCAFVNKKLSAGGGAGLKRNVRFSQTFMR